MKLLRPALLALVCSAPLLAAAQWQWVDKDGRKVFSDRPPPADIAPNRIVKAPAGRMPAAEEPAAAAAPAPAAAPAKPVAKVDKDLEARKKQAEAAEAEKRSAEEARNAAARADNCNRARQAKADLSSGVRIARTNAQGEREFMDDAARANEMKTVDAAIARDCGKTTASAGGAQPAP